MCTDTKLQTHTTSSTKPDKLRVSQNETVQLHIKPSAYLKNMHVV